MTKYLWYIYSRQTVPKIFYLKSIWVNNYDANTMLHISKCFNDRLINIQKQASKLRELQQITLQYLPIEMQAHCKVASFADGCLIINVDDAVWASQLRFILPEIRDNLRKNHNLYQLSNIKIAIHREYQNTLIKKPNTASKPQSPWHDILVLLQKI